MRSRHLFADGTNIALRANLLYRSSWLLWKFIFLQTMRVFTISPKMLDRSGGYVLAVTHISHLEVICAGLMTRREIRWITRKEFYCNRLVTCLLNAAGCLKINRQGIPVSTIRSAVAAARAGDVIGIFPEGGVVSGEELVIRGGPVKRGMSSIAIRAGVPIIPCVVLGTEKLNCARAWLPIRGGKLWIAFGDPIHPTVAGRSTQATRLELSERVRSSFRDLYQRLQDQYGVRDSDVP